MSDGPFKNAFDTDTTDIIRREITTYSTVNGMLIKEIVVRYYQDSQTYIPLVMQ